MSPAEGLDFGTGISVGYFSERTVTLQNTYLGADWTITQVATSHPAVKVISETCTAGHVLRKGGTCTITVRYSPILVGSLAGEKLQVTRTSAGGNFFLPLAGSAILSNPRMPSLPAAPTFSGIALTPAQGLAFEETPIGQTSLSQAVTLKNTYVGLASTVRAVDSTDPSQFEIASETCTAAPLVKNGGTCRVLVRFKPKASGLQTAKLSVTRDGAGGNFFVNLAGLGYGVTTGFSGAQLQPASLAFADTPKGGATAEQTIAITNTYKSTPWRVTGVGVNMTSFQVTQNTCVVELAPGASCLLKVAFTPTLAQNLTGALSISRQTAGTPSTLTVKLTGTGLAGPVTPASLLAEPGLATVPDALAGSAGADTRIKITNTGGAAVALKGLTVSGPFGATQDCPAQLMPQASCELRAQLKATQTGLQTGQLMLAHNGTGGMAVIPVRGTAVAPSVVRLADITPTSENIGVIMADGSLWSAGGNIGSHLTPNEPFMAGLFKQASNVRAASLEEGSTLVATTNNMLASTGYTPAWGLTVAPKATTAPGDIKKVISGIAFQFMLTTDGTIWQLGDETTLGNPAVLLVTPRVTWKPVLTNVSDISGSGFNTFALKADGSVWAMGYNGEGALGIPAIDTQTLTFTPVPGLTNVVAMAVGVHHSAVLKADGSVWATGLRASYTGTGEGQSRSFEPIFSGGAQLAVGENHTVVVKADGTLWAAGLVLGTGSGSDTTATGFQQVLSGVAKAQAGRDLTVVLRQDGSVWATGRNTSGQLGKGTATWGTNELGFIRVTQP